MLQLVSNSSLSLVLINHGDISVISKSGYLTVIRRTGIMIDLGVTVFVQTVRFALLSQRVALERLLQMLLPLLTHLPQSQLNRVLLSDPHSPSLRKQPYFIAPGLNGVSREGHVVLAKLHSGRERRKTAVFAGYHSPNNQ